MKVGLSYSRCLLDIIEGRVDYDDVLIIIARTDFDPNIDQEWQDIWEGYTRRSGYASPEWIYHSDKEDGESKFRDLSIKLWNDGKLHQPRKFGARPIRRSEYWLETCLPNSELERNPAAKKAWDQFQTIAGLTNIKLDKDYQ